MIDSAGLARGLGLGLHAHRIGRSFTQGRGEGEGAVGADGERFAIRAPQHQPGPQESADRAADAVGGDDRCDRFGGRWQRHESGAACAAASTTATGRKEGEQQGGGCMTGDR
ncbi:hypothetical protein D3C71_1238480 [compost metagenome]